MRILVIEDDDRIADFLQRALSTEGHTVTRLNSGKGAISILQSGDYKVILLDLMLPGMSGLDLCQEIRCRKINTPIIMLTAMDSIEDVVQGLKMGADDYMTKPFDLDELMARIETVCRRPHGMVGQNPVLRLANIRMNTDSKTVTVDGQVVSLTAKELNILELLMSNPEKLFSRERILSNIWGMNTDPLTNVVDVYIGRLRKKLGKDDAPFIETVRGMGYRIDQVILPKGTVD
ncbi:MAG: DNA-binding response OmpR family regulator [Granulosicoccus sp.]|jgi:DNA-binding response OmpR family regulator